MTTSNQTKTNELRKRFTRETENAIRAMLAMQAGR